MKLGEPKMRTMCENLEAMGKMLEYIMYGSNGAEVQKIIKESQRGGVRAI